MTPLKLCLFSLVLLVCSDFGAMLMNDRFGMNPRHSILIDRISSKNDSSSYFVPSVDKTAFTVNQQVWLQEFHISKVFRYDTTKEIPVHNVAVGVKFVKIANNSTAHEHLAEVIFVGHALLNSTHETKVKVPAKLPLHPGFIYEIRLKMPEKMHLKHTGALDILDYKINRFFSKAITITFFPSNSIGRLTKAHDHKRKISHGIVKRIQLIYSWF